MKQAVWGRRTGNREQALDLVLHAHQTVKNRHRRRFERMRAASGQAVRFHFFAQEDG